MLAAEIASVSAAAVVGGAALGLLRVRRRVARLRALWVERLGGAQAGAIANARPGYLELRALGATGGNRELFALRAALARTVPTAAATVAEARAAGAPVGELPRLASELSALANREDRALRLLQASGAPADLREPRARTGELIKLAEDLRRAAAQALHEVTAPDLDRLASELARERDAIADGLAHWRAPG